MMALMGYYESCIENTFPDSQELHRCWKIKVVSKQF